MDKMKGSESPTIYMGLIAIAAISFLSSLYLPVSEINKTLIGMPFVGALFMALFQISRDHSAHIRAKETQKENHEFIVAATSHMSKVVFDKHVEFSEEYKDKLFEIVSDLALLGPNEDDYKLAYKLNDIRRKYYLWISSDMEKKLNEFENQFIEVSKILLKAGRIKKAQEHSGEDKHKELTECYKEAHDIWSSMITVKDRFLDDDRTDNEDIKNSFGVVLIELKAILGIDRLTELRDSVLKDKS